MTQPLFPKKQNLLEQYQTTAKNALSKEDTLDKLRSSGISAMIDADNGLWINEMCMGQYNCIFAQNKVKELTSAAPISK